MSFEYFIGRRYLLARPQYGFISLISFLSVAGVTVGVMALIVVIAVMAGFEADLKSRILGVQSHVRVSREPRKMNDYKKIMTDLHKIRGIAAMTPVLQSQAMLRSAGGAAGVMLHGIDPLSAAQVHPNLFPSALEKLRSGDGPETDSLPGIILGKDAARNIGVTEGDEIYIISPRGMISPAGHMPSMKRFRLVGTFTSGMYEYDGTMAYISMRTAQKMLRTGDSITAIEIRTEQTYEAETLARQIAEKLGKDYQVKDWTEMNRTFFSALKLEKTAMFVILTLIILVAAFNIAGSLFMMVMEKRRDIAILKAMGAAEQSIRKIFVFKGLAVGCIGTALGTVIGTGLCALLSRYKFIELPSDIYYITTIPVRLSIWDVLMIAAAAVIICFLSTLYPAVRASASDPVEAIRYG
ncbi:MAG: lipoprotein-releasing ABC transporter permease subunit [Desulfococcaceae bacterium]|jgi:lipoprotein-releasing system permease protein|nr:lipoprotein-releasing ABC transporter permease subunit [Desulfococcaceae bacterium]